MFHGKLCTRFSDRLSCDNITDATAPWPGNAIRFHIFAHKPMWERQVRIVRILTLVNGSPFSSTPLLIIAAARFGVIIWFAFTSTLHLYADCLFTNLPVIRSSRLSISSFPEAPWILWHTYQGLSSCACTAIRLRTIRSPELRLERWLSNRMAEV